MWDFSNVQSMEGGAQRRDVVSGGYVCTITSAAVQKTKSGKDELFLTWDIADGEFAGFFSDDFFANKPFKHCAHLMLDDANMGYTKRKLECIALSNAGVAASFDPFYALNCNPQLFVGKRVGIVLQQRLYTYAGIDRSEVEVAAFKPVQDIVAGNFTTPPVKDERTKQPVASASNDDIPF